MLARVSKVVSNPILIRSFSANVQKICQTGILPEGNNNAYYGIYNLDYNKLQQFKPCANCLHAHADKGMLRNDEVVVYKEDQITIRYLIEIGN